MKTPAAVLFETGKDLELVELEIPKLNPGQVLVDISYSGVCHTQLSEVRGYRGPDKFLPHCLGHEGSGRVLEIGAGVRKVKVGDRVVLSWLKGSGADVPGTKYKLGSRDVNAGGVTTFMKLAVLSENRVSALGNDVEDLPAALLGCALPTGFGSISNTVRAEPGSKVIVFGVGGVGLCAVAGASFLKCSEIVAVDINSSRLEGARSFGATSTINAPLSTERLRELANKFDLAIEVTGRPEIINQALQLVRPRGGIVVIVGNPKAGELLTLDPRIFNEGKQIRGTWGGDSNPDIDQPKLQKMLSEGVLNLRPLYEHVYPLENINQALRDLETGSVLRPMLKMDA